MCYVSYINYGQKFAFVQIQLQRPNEAAAAIQYFFLTSAGQFSILLVDLWEISAASAVLLALAFIEGWKMAFKSYLISY